MDKYRTGLFNSSGGGLIDVMVLTGLAVASTGEGVGTVKGSVMLTVLGRIGANTLKQTMYAAHASGWSLKQLVTSGPSR